MDQNENREKKEQKENSFQFMKETIREKPVSRKEKLKKYLKKLLLVLAAAVAAGAIAAGVFLGLTSDARKSIEESANRVELAEQTTPTPTATPEPTPEEEIQEPSPTPEITPEPVGIEDYQNIYEEMKVVATEGNRSIVQVIGITSQMDYFNQNYENQQQISGVIVAENEDNLYILTEYRVLENVERIRLKFCDDSSADAIFQAHDSGTGLAILTTAVKDLPEGTYDKIAVCQLENVNPAMQGDPVMALGSPMGYSDALSYGVVTSTTNVVSVPDHEYALLTTDILGSNDGSGVLMSMEGNVVGIIDQSLSSDSDKTTVTALQASELRDLIERLSNKETSAYIGIRGQNVTVELSEQTGIPKGVLVTEVEEGSPAMLAGLMEYDVLTGIDDVSFETISLYSTALNGIKPGQKVTLHVMRKGAEGYAEIDIPVEAAAAE